MASMIQALYGRYDLKGYIGNQNQTNFLAQNSPLFVYVSICRYQNVEAEKLSSILIDKEGVKHGFSIPRGMLRTEVSEEQKHFAARVMPEPLHAMISATKDIFVQAIHDFLAPQHSIKDRIALVGDSGAILRPHTAAGTTKAALNAWSLSSCLQKYNFDVPTALQAYHNAMQPVARELVDIGISIGTQSQCTEKRFDSQNLPGTWKQQNVVSLV